MSVSLLSNNGNYQMKKKTLKILIFKVFWSGLVSLTMYGLKEQQFNPNVYYLGSTKRYCRNKDSLTYWHKENNGTWEERLKEVEGVCEAEKEGWEMER